MVSIICKSPGGVFKYPYKLRCFHGEVDGRSQSVRSKRLLGLNSTKNSFDSFFIQDASILNKRVGIPESGGSGGASFLLSITSKSVIFVVFMMSLQQR